MNKKILVISAILVLVAGVYVLAGIESQAARTGAGNDNVVIGYKGHVDVFKIPAGGNEILISSKDNLLVTNGKSYIRNQIGDGTSVAANSTKYISLSDNATAPDTSYTVLPAEINANGLSRATATYAANGTGAWNYTYTWTATGAQTSQLTGLHYVSTPASDGNLFAALQFTQVSLQANDQLKIIWSISVS